MLPEGYPKKKLCAEVKCRKEIAYESLKCEHCGFEYKTVGFWNRMSHQNSVDTESHLNHRDRAIDYCNFNGMMIVTEYSLLAVPGKLIREEKEYLRYRHDVKSKKYDVFLITKLKRFSRKVSILCEEASFLNQNKVDFVSIDEKIDTTSAYGKFFYVVMSALAELESDEVSGRIKDSIVPRAEKGKPLGNHAPLGYDWVELKKIDEKQRKEYGYDRDEAE